MILSIAVTVQKKVYRRNIVLPKSWEEVDYKLFYRITPNLLLAKAGDIDAKIQILNVMVENQVKDLFEYKKATVFFQDDDLVNSIDINALLIEAFDKTPFEFFSLNGQKYFMPASKFGNFTMGEFHHVCQYFQRYNKTNKVEYLLKLMATIARPVRSKNDDYQKWSFDKRRPLLVHEIAERAKTFEDLDAALLFATYQYVQGSLQALQKKYQIFEYVDPDKKELSLKEKLELKLNELREAGKPVGKEDLEKIKRELLSKSSWRDVIDRLFREYGLGFEYWFNFPLYTGLSFLKSERESIEKEIEQIKSLRTENNDLK